MIYDFRFTIMKEKIKRRMLCFAIDCGKLCMRFPISREYNAYCNQLIRCSSSVGANYRAACRGKSDRDFINKLKIVEEEADEFLSITIASIITVRKRLDKK